MSQSELPVPPMPAVALPVVSYDGGPPLVPGVDAPKFKLFSVGAVVLATFLGTPLAGTILMAINDLRIGRKAAAVLEVVAGIVGTTVLILIGLSIPTGGNYAIGIVVLVLMRYIAEARFGQILKSHTDAGGRLSSNWNAAGIGLIFLVLVVGAIVGGIMVGRGTKYIVGTKDEVYYSGDATAADAAALGKELQADNYFTDKGFSVTLKKSGGAATIGFVVQDGAWDKPNIISDFTAMGPPLKKSVGGSSLTIRLLDDTLTEHKSITIDK